MLVLFHLIYIYTEYLWSFIIKRGNSSEAALIESNEHDNELHNESDPLIQNDLADSNCDLSGVLDFPYDNLKFEDSKADDKYVFEDVEGCNKACFDDLTNKIKFYPPLYIQRYIRTIEILTEERWKNDIKKVIDIGCSELKFFKYLKNVTNIENILEIDIDKDVLQKHSYRIQPLPHDFFSNRTTPLEVSLLCGNAAVPDRHLEGVDAVIAIELIEHLYPPDLEALPYNVFSVIKPRLAIFTTPNEEFNVLFDNFSGFRHEDHKFEWSRSEFESWAVNICSRFPYYEVRFFGIGPGPSSHENLGCCSQGAVFIRNDSTPIPDEYKFIEPLNNFNEYDVIDHVVYPYKEDLRGYDERTLDDAIRFINLACGMTIFAEHGKIIIPLSSILIRTSGTCTSTSKLKELLEKENFNIEKDDYGDYILVLRDYYPKLLDSDSDEDEDEEQRDVMVENYVEPKLEEFSAEDLYWNTEGKTKYDEY